MWAWKSRRLCIWALEKGRRTSNRQSRVMDAPFIGQCLLVVGGDASVEPGAERFSPCPKTPLESGVETRCVFRGLSMR